MAEPQKVIFDVCIHDKKHQRKAMKAISKLRGIISIDMDMNDQKLTVVGFFDPICGHKKLKKVCDTKILIVEIVKKEEPKPDEPKKEEPKKEEPKKEDENENTKVWPCQPCPYHPCMTPQHYIVTTIDEYPSRNCVIS